MPRGPNCIVMKRILVALLALYSISNFSSRGDAVVVFNEVMYHPATNEPAMEWVELRNQLAVDVDISDWSLDGGIQYRFPSNTIVKGRGFLVVALLPSALGALTGQTNIYGPFAGRLGNNGDTLRLLNNSGRLMDELAYGIEAEWPVAPDGSGASLAKLDRDGPTAAPSNWRASEQVGGTPGADNFPFYESSPPDSLLLAINDTWLYHDGGEDLGEGWRAPGYVDAAWPSRSSFTNQPITTLYNTGVGANGAVLADGAADPHYILTAAAQGTVGGSATVQLNHPNWLANDSTSKWIGVVANGSTGVAQGPYHYRTTFSLAGFLPSTVRLNLVLAADNSVSDVLLNGVSTGISYVGFSALSGAYTLSSGFEDGTNTLEFRTMNDPTTPNPAGFRAVLSGTGLGVNPHSPMVSGRATYYFRKHFYFNGDPAYAELRLRTLVSDGAVFYLNGTEVYRQNMPTGPIAYTTPALSDVPLPGYSAPVEISTTSLAVGINVLAVEVHQAAGGTEGALLGVELFYRPLERPPVTLAFNETASATNAAFFVEVVNYGTNPVSLADCRLIHDGAGTNDHIFAFSPTVLPPGAFLALTNATLGFQPLSGDRLYLMNQNGYGVLDGIVVKNTLRGRYPDGRGRWLRPAQPSPSAPNDFTFHSDVVINEIMYHHAVLPSTNNQPSQPSPEAWVELYNRGPAPVDLTGWELAGGISYAFAPGTLIPSGGYLVVAEDAAALRTLYPSIAIVGNFAGRLSGKGEYLWLRDPLGNPADEVYYRDEGHWPAYADGGGSSLELKDPNADNANPAAWAASDESGKSAWETVAYRMVANVPSGSGQPTQWNDFVFGLLDQGECLIDDLSVVENPGGNAVQFINNGNFENGLVGWRVLGTHGKSRVESEEGNPGNHVLHLIATGPQEHMHNHVETTYAGGRTVVNGREYEIRYRVKWLAGNNLLNTRLYFNRCARTHAMTIPGLNGTPGARNSRWVANIGPTFEGLKHWPVVPLSGQPVNVSIRAADPQGVTNCTLWYSTNSGPWLSAPMTARPGEWFGVIPGYGSNTVVQFYVQAMDGQGASSTWPPGGVNSGALYKVQDGQANLSLAHNVRIIMTPANIDLMHGTSGSQTNVMSNELLPCTVVYNERRVYYDCAVHLRGSQRGRYSDTRTGFHINFQPDDLFRGVHPVMLIDRSGQGDATANRQEEIILKHMLNRAGGIPGTYSEICRVLAPRSVHTGPAQFFPRHEDLFIESAFDNGGDGTMFEMELIYYPTTANAAGYKLPQPDGVIGTDVTNLGDDKEIYRYNFMIKNHRDVDDYRPFIALAKAWSLSGAALDTQTRQLMDIDQWMRAYALVSLFSVGDMYTFGNNHNFFMYVRPSDGKILYFPWDMDFVFSRGSTGALVGDQNLSKVVNLPGNLRRMYAHMLDIIGVSFNTAYMSYWLDHYDDFAPGQSYVPRLTTIAERVTYVRNAINAVGGNAAFNITSGTQVTTSTNLVTITGTAPVGAYTIKVNAVEYPVTWSSLSSWSLRVPVTGGSNVLVVTAFDVNGNALTNLSRVVHVNYTGPVPAPEGSVVINEIMYNPREPDAAYLELHNSASQFAFDLSNWRINGLGYTFPPGSYIGPGQFLVLANNLQAYFKAYGSNAPVPYAVFPGNLQNGGERITLLRPGDNPGEEIVVDEVRYDSVAPWPTAANGLGSALQLIDPSQDRRRVCNWFSDYSQAYTNYDWRFVSITARMGSTPRLLFYLNEPGDIYIDQIALVSGTNAEVGYNFVRNGDFEAPLIDDPPLTNSYSIGTNYTGSHLSTDIKRSGNSSLHMVSTATPAGTNRMFYQNLSPAPTNTELCTLSCWFLPTLTATTLNVRVQSSTLSLTLNARPNLVPEAIYATPGAANVTTITTLEPIPPVWINEVQAENLTGVQDHLGHRTSWIELYNAGTNAVALQNMFLADNYTNLAQWAFPTGAILAPGEFRIVFADSSPSESTSNEWHSSFTLSPGGGSVALSRLSGGRMEVLDYLNYQMRPDRSFGCYPDGQPYGRQEFYHPTPSAPNTNTSGPLTVFINEWMADNARSLMNTNNNNRYDDWFELYNASDSPADLTGFFLTDSPVNPFQFAIPAGRTIAPHGYLLVWADNRPELNTNAAGELHVNFRLDQAGEHLGLYGADGTPVDLVLFGAQLEDLTQGRYPDGAADVYFLQTPTPDSANSPWANRPPVITPPASVSAVLGIPLSLFVPASDPEAPQQTLTWSLVTPSPAEASINPATGLFSWTPIAAGTNWVTVRVTDNGTPALSAMASFSIIVNSGFPISGLTPPVNGIVALSFATIPGRTYQVEYKEDLNTAVWTPLGQPTAASGTSLTINDSVVDIGQRFYRVVQLP